MSTCNWLDLQALGSQPVMPKNLSDHWSERLKSFTCLWFGPMILNGSRQGIEEQCCGRSSIGDHC